MTLFERLRDAPAICMIPQQGGVGTPTVGLTDRERAAVLNLIEAAQHWKEINDKSEERGVSQDTGTFIAWQDFCEALAVFVSGQEESA